MSTTLAIPQEIRLKPRDKIVGWAGTKTNPIPIVQAPAKRSGLKTPKAVRDKIAKSRSKIKIPVVAGTIITGPIISAIVQALEHSKLSGKLRRFYIEILENYTGIELGFTQLKYLSWDWKKPAISWGSLAGLILDARYLGARRYANQQLGQMNIPFFRV